MSQVSAEEPQKLPKTKNSKIFKHFNSGQQPLIGKKDTSGSLFLPKFSRSSHSEIKKESHHLGLFRSKSDPNQLIDSSTSPKDPSEIPTCDLILDLGKLHKGPELRNEVLSLIHLLLPGWGDITDQSQIHLESISGALTNRVFIVTATSYNDPLRVVRKVLLRVYGIGVEQLLAREKELEFLRMLSSIRIGPLLLGIFQNGRFEQYLDSKTLTHDDIRNLETSRHIAQRMVRLHHIVEDFPAPSDVVPELWVDIHKWYPLAIKVISSEKFQNDPLRAKRLKDFDVVKLKGEIDELKKEILALDTPLVFAHNDTQYGNILRLNDGSEELVVVDFEYAGYNYKWFDIANHFCEWGFNYHSSQPHLFHPEWYPTKAEQINFLKSYVEAEKKLSRASDNHSINYNLESRRVECEVFVLASHVMWGLWGLVQAGQSQIPFDYFEYGMQRLEQFRKLKRMVSKDI